MAVNVSLLKKSTITIDYLNSNASTHSFLFGAMCELVDNARDADATSLRIFVEEEYHEGKFRLSFLDDGMGMTPKECSDLMKLGVSNKKNDNAIGRYGNGLKSAALRIANDFIVLTKNSGKLSIAFLSRTFYKQEKIQKSDVFVALPSFNELDKTPIFDSNVGKRIAEARHDCEMYLITKYSPFKTQEEIFRQFDRIEGSSGTIIVLFNLLENNFGTPQITFDREQNDIVMVDDQTNTETFDYVPLERRSFTEYLKILYSNPRMKIYLNDRKIRTKKLQNCLYQPYSYRHISKQAVSQKIEEDINRAEDDLDKTRQRLREATSLLSEAKKDYSVPNAEYYRNINKNDILVNNLKAEIENKTKELENLKKLMRKTEKKFVFTFGLNIQNRAQSGAFFYNQNRLIAMYKKIGKQRQNDLEYHGIVAIVDVPYDQMLPQHNKQGFADEAEYERLKKALSDYIDSYYYDIKYYLHVEKLQDFWELCGYSGDNDEPSNIEAHWKNRFCRIELSVQCDSCLKWRSLQASSVLRNFIFPDTWSCGRLNKSCSEPESIKTLEFREKRPVATRNPRPKMPPPAAIPAKQKSQKPQEKVGDARLNFAEFLRRKKMQQMVEENRQVEDERTSGTVLESDRDSRVNKKLRDDANIKARKERDHEIYTKETTLRKYFAADPSELEIKSSKDAEDLLREHIRRIKLLLHVVAPGVFKDCSDDFILSFDYVRYIINRFRETKEDTVIL